MGRIERVTMFEVPNEADYPKVIEQYESLQ